MPFARLIIPTMTLWLFPGSQGLLAENERSPGYFSVVSVPDSEFSEARLVDLCHDILKRQREPLISVWFFTSDEHAADFFSGKLSDHIRYDTWLPSYNRLKDIRPIGRLVSINGSSVLLFLGRDRSVDRQVLAGTNPLDIVLRTGKELHLLDCVRSARLARSKELRATVFAWTPQPLTESLGQQALTELRREIPYEDMTLHVRNDPWFIDEPPFPAFWPFDPEFPSPSKAQWTASPTLVCGKPSSSDRYNCRMFFRHG